MNIRQVTDGKEDYIELLRAGDPDESRIRKLLEKGELFLLEEHGKLRTLCIVIFSEEKKCEIKNIVTIKKDQGKGYGRYMIHYICEHYCAQYDWVYMKKERCLDIMEFCEKCGFSDEDEKYLKKELMSEIDTKRVINLAMEAGRMLLKNGGEIFRVEETMMRICHRFGVKYVDLFTLSHGLFICAGTDKEKLYTKVKQVPLSSTHLGIVAEVNDLSREIAAGHVGIEEAWKKLKQINKICVVIVCRKTRNFQNPGSHCRRNYYCFDGVGSNTDTGIWKSADGRNCNRRNHAIGTGTCFCKCNP